MTSFTKFNREFAFQKGQKWMDEVSTFMSGRSSEIWAYQTRFGHESDKFAVYTAKVARFTSGESVSSTI
jgi:hypothetical protein